ncbi:MAG: hypothetical protein QNL52_08520 [Synechococcus sp. ChBW.bin.23]
MAITAELGDGPNHHTHHRSFWTKGRWFWGPWLHPVMKSLEMGLSL